MPPQRISVNVSDIIQIKEDLAFIKSRLLEDDDEGELSDWAKQELEEARKIPLSECVSHEDVIKMFEEKWGTK